MTDQISHNDIAAFRDVLRDLQEEAQGDAMSTERAAELMDLLEVVKRDVGDTIAFLKSRAVISLEGGSKVIGEHAYSTKPVGKYRPNHKLIQHRTVQAAIHDEDTGMLIDNVVIAATRAVELYHALYVAPKTAPKAEGLRAIHVSKKEATTWEDLGRELVVTDLRVETHD